ncbi:hypothetical protein B0H11DRAFT_1912107 [Mycena galericulata]|nr:hypothetical protein B0H11DRAFT_1912107 [Mycena galericulata]
MARPSTGLNGNEMELEDESKKNWRRASRPGWREIHLDPGTIAKDIYRPFRGGTGRNEYVVLAVEKCTKPRNGLPRVLHQKIQGSDRRCVASEAVLHTGDRRQRPQHFDLKCTCQGTSTGQAADKSRGGPDAWVGPEISGDFFGLGLGPGYQHGTIYASKKLTVKSMAGQRRSRPESNAPIWGGRIESLTRTDSTPKPSSRSASQRGFGSGRCTQLRDCHSQSHRSSRGKDEIRAETGVVVVNGSGAVDESISKGQARQGRVATKEDRDSRIMVCSKIVAIGADGNEHNWGDEGRKGGKCTGDEVRTLRGVAIPGKRIVPDESNNPIRDTDPTCGEGARNGRVGTPVPRVTEPEPCLEAPQRDGEDPRSGYPGVRRGHLHPWVQAAVQEGPVRWFRVEQVASGVPSRIGEYYMKTW